MRREPEPIPAPLITEAAGVSYRHILPVLEKLIGAGHEAVLVGGGIRDLLLGRPVSDWDVSTSAVPEAVITLWPDAVPTGIRHGTVTLPLPEGPVEITTYRSEGPYSDGRRPDWVRFGSTLDEDLSRRDFTVNAFALDPIGGGFHDPSRGLEDLDRRLLRTVGSPEERFAEDGLRPLRGIRLAAVLEFDIEPATWVAMTRSVEGVRRVATERIRGELMKMLDARRPSRGVELLQESGLLDAVLPEIQESVGVSQNRFHAYDVFVHSLKTLDAAPVEKPMVRLAALLHDVGKPRSKKVVDGEGTFHGHERVGAEMTREMLDRLRFSRAEREKVTHLVREHMFHYTPQWSDAAVRRFLKRVGVEEVEDLFDLRRADDKAQGTGKDDTETLRELEERIRGIRARAEALSVRDLAVGGEDVMRVAGIPAGPGIGRLLEALLEEVLENPERNTREFLLERIRERSRLDGGEDPA